MIDIQEHAAQACEALRQAVDEALMHKRRLAQRAIIFENGEPKTMRNSDQTNRLIDWLTTDGRNTIIEKAIDGCTDATKDIIRESMNGHANEHEQEKLLSYFETQMDAATPVIHEAHAERKAFLQSDAMQKYYARELDPFSEAELIARCAMEHMAQSKTPEECEADFAAFNASIRDGEEQRICGEALAARDALRERQARGGSKGSKHRRRNEAVQYMAKIRHQGKKLEVFIHELKNDDIDFDCPLEYSKEKGKFYFKDGGKKAITENTLRGYWIDAGKIEKNGLTG